MIFEMEDKNRRSVIKSLSILGIAPSSVAVAKGKSNRKRNHKGVGIDWKNMKEDLSEKYPRKEAVIATNITKKHYRKSGMEKKNTMKELSKAEVHDAVESLEKKLIEHPVTDQIGEDIKELKEEKRVHNEAIVREEKK